MLLLTFLLEFFIKFSTEWHRTFFFWFAISIEIQLIELYRMVYENKKSVSNFAFVQPWKTYFLLLHDLYRDKFYMQRLNYALHIGACKYIYMWINYSPLKNFYFVVKKTRPKWAVISVRRDSRKCISTLVCLCMGRWARTEQLFQIIVKV